MAAGHSKEGFGLSLRGGITKPDRERGEPMPQDSDLEHEFLELRTEGLGEKSFLGGLRLATRGTLFLLLGLAALAALAGIYIYVDQRLGSALDHWAATHEVARLTGQVETGMARIEGHEKRFLLSKDPATADAFNTDIASTSKALDTLDALAAAGQRQHVATIRDGLAQYDQQFVQLVEREKSLGLSDGTGVSQRLEESTTALQSGFKAAGFDNLADQVTRINTQGQETLLSGFRKGVEEIQQRYRTLAAFLDSAEIPAGEKSAIGNLLKAHETDMLAMINSRFALDSETQRFSEILAYVQPSLQSLSEFSGQATDAAAKALARNQTFARTTLATGSAAIVLWLIFAGLVIMRSVSSPIRNLSLAAGLLAEGDRSVKVPTRGNIDATGQLARSLDKWIDDLVEMDLLRQELDQTRARLEHTVEQAERDAKAAAEAARAALLSDEREPIRAEEPEPVSPQPAARREPAGAGPISSVSQQLAHFSEYVTAAADDVERTEALIRGLADTTRQIEDMSLLVMSIRDQTNLLAFRSGPRGGRDGANLIPFDGDERRSAVEAEITDKAVAQRLDTIREATDRAERTVQSVRLSIADVTAMAQEIASTASTQALEATNKLLHQSEYLQNMLDDIVAKVRPPSSGQLPGPDRDDASPPKAGPMERKPPGKT